MVVLAIFQRFIKEGALKKLLQLWAVQAVIIMGLFGMHSYLGAVLLWVLPWARLSRWSNRGTCHRIIYNCVNTLLECNYNNLFESPNLSTPIREYQNRNDFIQTYPNLYPNISKPIRTFPNLAKLSQTYPNLFEPFQTYPNIAELIQACQVKARKINFCKLYKWILLSSSHFNSCWMNGGHFRRSGYKDIFSFYYRNLSPFVIFWYTPEQNIFTNHFKPYLYVSNIISQKSTLANTIKVRISLGVFSIFSVEFW